MIRDVYGSVGVVNRIWDGRLTNLGSTPGRSKHFYVLSQNCDKRLLDPSRVSVRPSASNISASTVRIFMKSDIFSIFSKSVEKIQVSLKSDKNNGYFT
jgi:hypothetical protein